MTQKNMLKPVLNIVLLIAFFLLKPEFSLAIQNHTFAGTIGENAIYMEIQLLDYDNVTVNYFYKSQLRNIFLGGEIDDKGALRLHTEYDDPEGNITEWITMNWDSKGMTGTWKQGKKSLKITLSPPAQSDISNNKVLRNPIIAKGSYSDFEKIKMGLFRLESLDSISYTNGVKLRHFKEPHCGVELFRVDSGLVAKNLMQANYLLEDVHIEQFLEAMSCPFNDDISTYYVSYQDLFIDQNWITFYIEKWWNCGSPHATFYEYGVNLNTRTGQNIYLYNLVKSGYCSSNVELGDDFGIKALQYLSENYPEYFTESEEDNENDSEHCYYNDPELWNSPGYLIQANGMIRLIPFTNGHYSTCNQVNWAEIPFSELSEFIKPEYLNDLKAISH